MELSIEEKQQVRNEISDNNESNSPADVYIDWIYKYRYYIVCISWISIIIAAIIGMNAFFILESGGYEPPGAESTKVYDRMYTYLTYPDYPLALLMNDPTGRLKPDDA